LVEYPFLKPRAINKKKFCLLALAYKKITITINYEGAKLKEKFNKDNFDWHEMIQNIFDKYLPLMSGKVIKEPGREYPRYFEVDYYCLAEGNLPELADSKIVRPFDHFKKRNIIEYKSIHQVLNEDTFRHYVGRALLMENSDFYSYRSSLTLTILTTRKPLSLIKEKTYALKKINDWKYRSYWIKDLEVYILVQKEMRKKQEGEALALLQVLEGQKSKQAEIWESILNQDLDNVDIVKNIIKQINQEVYMNLIQQVREEGKIQGRTEGEIQALIKILRKRFGNVPDNIQNRLHQLSSLEQVEKLLDLVLACNSLDQFTKEAKI
jgi:hypothetical protein